MPFLSIAKILVCGLTVSVSKIILSCLIWTVSILQHKGSFSLTITIIVVVVVVVVVAVVVVTVSSSTSSSKIVVKVVVVVDVVVVVVAIYHLFYLFFISFSLTLTFFILQRNSCTKKLVCQKYSTPIYVKKYTTGKIN